MAVSCDRPIRKAAARGSAHTRRDRGQTSPQLLVDSRLNQATGQLVKTRVKKIKVKNGTEVITVICAAHSGVFIVKVSYFK